MAANVIYNLVTRADRINDDQVALIETLESMSMRDRKTALATLTRQAMAMYCADEYESHAKIMPCVSVTPSKSDNGMLSIKYDAESEWSLEGKSLCDHFKNRLARYVYPALKRAGLFKGRERGAVKLTPKKIAEKIEAMAMFKDLTATQKRSVIAALNASV